MTITAARVADKMTEAGLVALPRLAERWARDFERDGLPDYGSGRYEDLSSLERGTAYREHVVFGTGPYTRKVATNNAFDAIVGASLGDVAAA